VRVLLLPDVEGGLAHAHLPTDVRHGRAAFDLAEDVGDLLLGELRLLHGHSSWGTVRSRYLPLGVAAVVAGEHPVTGHYERGNAGVQMGLVTLQRVTPSAAACTRISDTSALNKFNPSRTRRIFGESPSPIFPFHRVDALGP